MSDYDEDEALDQILYGPSSDEDDNESSTLIQCGGPCKKKHPAESIIRCLDSHSFCFDDARAYTTGKLGTGALVLNCMNANCDKVFPGTEVLRYIDLRTFAGLPKERLEIMIDAVGVRGLVEICPYCNAVNNTGPLSKTTVVECFNCKKSSCRKCHKRAHGDKDCEEAHKDSLECGHCLKDYPAEEIVRCQNGHPFCLTAAKEYLASQLGKGVPVLQCVQPGCDKIFPGVEVLRFIDLNVFKGVPKERLEIMIERVDVKGLVEICPKCVTVVACGPVEQNSEFVCTNSTCGESHCRKCGKEVHSSLTCEEYEKKKNQESEGQAGAGIDLGACLSDIIASAFRAGRVAFQIEAMLNDAILRTCNSCDTKLLKKDGRNMINCDDCGNRQCYTCLEDVTGLDHFFQRPACHLYDEVA